MAVRRLFEGYADNSEEAKDNSSWWAYDQQNQSQFKEALLRDRQLITVLSGFILAASFSSIGEQVNIDGIGNYVIIFELIVFALSFLTMCFAIFESFEINKRPSWSMEQYRNRSHFRWMKCESWVFMCALLLCLPVAVTLRIVDSSASASYEASIIRGGVSITIIGGMFVIITCRYYASQDLQRSDFRNRVVNRVVV